MMNVYRVVDANINRVSEGLRVLEDISRFIIENSKMTETIRDIRHKVRKTTPKLSLIESRDSMKDIGYEISKKTTLDIKKDLKDIIDANFKRVQEGLRSIEEHLKIIGYYEESKIYEGLRYKTYDLEKNFKSKKLVLNTDIYGITSEEFSLGRSNIEVVKNMIEARIKVIQYREKNKSKHEKYIECKKIRDITKEKDVIFIVNDDVDIAMSINADGIHLGQDDMPIKEVRKLSKNMMIGISTHNKNQAKKAVKDGADYIGVGPIFKTNTKKNVEKSEGLKYLKWVSENIDIPYVSIGGINESNISEVKKYGGKCFAMISEIVASKDIEKKVKNLRELI
ncbi:MAG: thiamine phosphate synthase [Firmicutes bacterium]|nr:thiamine phosphate synthase [Bacillota bacterium]